MDNHPLVIDLDGTLIRTDLLWESLFILAKQKPLHLLHLPFWLLQGKSVLKEKLAHLAPPTISLLPYNQEVLALIESAHSEGRDIILATASHHSLAEQIAAHTKLFKKTISTAGRQNMKGAAKLLALRSQIGVAFDYIGDSLADIPLWKVAGKAYCASKSKFHAFLIKLFRTDIVFLESAASARSAFRALRPVQWLKNLLVFIPLITSHSMFNPARLAPALLAFVTVCACASGTYLLNDIIDLESDRRHAVKRRRPFAAGELTIPFGLFLSGLLICSSLYIAFISFDSSFVNALAAYMVLTLVYTFYMKGKKIADVLLLAGLYAIRVIMGGAATGIPISRWLLAFSVFFFYSLALAKRSIEISGMKAAGIEKTHGRDYFSADDHVVLATGIASGYLAVLVFMLFVNDLEHVGRLYSRPDMLFLVAPILLYWITRVWFLTVRGVMDVDPVVFAAKDAVSWFSGVCIACLFTAAALL